MNKQFLKRLGLGLLALITIVLFSAPRVAESYITRNSIELIGRKIEVQKIRINYFNGSLKVYKFSMFEKKTSDVFLSFDKLLVNLDYWPLLRNELLISQILIENLNTQIIQEGELFNFSDFIESEDADTLSQPKDAEKEPIVISLHNIELSSSNLLYTDVLLDHSISLDDVDLMIPGFTLNKGTTNLELDFDLARGGSFYSKLNLDQDQGSFRIDLQLDSLNVDVIEPYIKESMLISDVNGYFSNKVELLGNMQHLTQLVVKGVNSIDGFALVDSKGRKVLSFEKLVVGLNSFAMETNQLHLSEITLKEPEVLLEMIDSTNNWLAMMITNQEMDSIAADSVIEQQESNFSYVLDKLSLQQGKVVFADRTLDSDFESTIHDIEISSQNLSATSGEVDFVFSAEINETGVMRSDFVVDMTNVNDFKLDFSLQKFDMKDVEPYMMHYFGYSVDEGLMNFSTENILKGSSVVSDNKLYVRKFELGKENKSEARIKLPLRLALGILSDKEDVIDLAIPVESNEEETSIGNLGKLIAKAVGNLFVKAATSPADLLGIFYDYDPEKLRVVHMEMFESFPASEDLKTLDVLAQILNDKPQLRVEMSHYLNRDEYFDSLAYATVISDWISYDKNKWLTVSDSALKKFILAEEPDLQLDTSLSIRECSRYYCDSAYLAASYDSIRMQQVDFISDYLIEHKGVSSEKLNIKEYAADSLLVNHSKASFFIEFLSEASLHE